MRPAQILKEINELRESWRKQNFLFTPEQQKEFDRLKELRRERVKYFYANGLVSKGGSKATTDAKQP